jgi:UDP-N-acetylmuramate dehydrogenase
MSQTIREDVPLAPLTTFGIGGAARYFVEVHNDADLLDALRYADRMRLSATVLSGGSNVLIPDSGIDGLVIHITSDTYHIDGYTLRANAGCSLLSLIKSASSQSLGGWEKLAGIPGTIGGAVRGNAGAFGPEIKDFVAEVMALNRTDFTSRTFGVAQCEFAYRSSYFKHHPEWIITHITLRLQDAEPELSLDLIRETIVERERRHLQNVRAAGSFFMNPQAPLELVRIFEAEKGVTSREQRVPAGWLIEKAGMKGAIVGGAIASMQHPNYIVNQGSATAQDVRNLAASIKQAVQAMFGVELREEAALL